ncbi:FAD/NAD(P)-binding protein [Alkalicoccus halolimnae]|uniref:FAD/NAD(P)-binding protein n=1 Tax=Alkalicoccus halolimnae TaxID=1667239 RepID=A0AAJ8LSJ2_9BACI|nr:FAD/NAD(P)-binding protein [Alkalicoccus halolimnae]
MKKWTIIGGGIQGITAAVHLLERNVCAIDELCVIDPHEAPLHVWKKRTSKIEMPYLRSSFVHHLSSDPFSLENYASSDKDFYGRYKRPSIELFNEHCAYLIDSLGISTSWVQDTVTGLEKSAGHWYVNLKSGKQAVSQFVILAPGGGQKLHMPDPLTETAVHIFDPHFDLDNAGSTPAVIGGGISAAHTALYLSRKKNKKVTFIKRHPLRVHPFDSDPAWLGPKNMRKFTMMNNYGSRRKCLHDARYTGSMPRELYFRLLQEQRRGNVVFQDAHITDSVSRNGKVELFDRNLSLGIFDSVICCTGFKNKLPEAGWLHSLISRYSLPCASCGYPVLSSSLLWEDSLFAVGALAELEIGPVARNISGAQRAAARITAFAEAQKITAGL